MALAFLAASAFWLFPFIGDRQWHKDHPGAGASGVPDPLWLLLLWIALPLVPYLLSGLLLSTRGEESKAGGAGVAAGLFAWGFIFAIVAFVSLFFRFSPDPYGLQNTIAVVTFFACSFWIIVSAIRIGKGPNWGVFLLSAVATLTCMAWGYHSLESADARVDREYEQRRREAESPPFYRPVGAQQTIVSFAGCPPCCFFVLNLLDHANFF
jgi:hypothetical protein